MVVMPVVVLTNADVRIGAGWRLFPAPFRSIPRRYGATPLSWIELPRIGLSGELYKMPTPSPSL